jgi:secreted Zn-dependent insulinase-like peptidase
MKNELSIFGVTLVTLIAVAGLYVWGFQEVTRISVIFPVAAQNQSEAFRAQEAEVFSHFAQSNDIVTFLTYVETRGQAYDATVSVASVSDTAATGNITLALTIQGSFSAVMKTLAALEYGSYALSAQTITLEKRTEGPWELKGTFTAATELP